MNKNERIVHMRGNDGCKMDKRNCFCIFLDSPDPKKKFVTGKENKIYRLYIYIYIYIYI